MAVRFVPPPGWPVPPGFTPTTEWHPDPSWPPPPPGWVFWQDSDGAPPVPQDPVVRSTEPLPVGAGTASAGSPTGTVDTGLTRRSMRERSSGATPVVVPSSTAADPDATAIALAPVPATPPGPPAPPAPSPSALGDHPVVSSTMILPALGGLADGTAPLPPAPTAPTVSVGSPRSGVVPVGPARPGPTPGAPAAPGPAVRPAVASVGPLSLPGADDDGEHAPERGRRWLVPAAVGLAGVAVGLLVGIGLTLTAQSDAEQARAEAQRVQNEVSAERAQLESERADLETQRAALDAATTTLTEREAAVAKAEEDATKRTEELDERQSAQDKRDEETKKKDEEKAQEEQEEQESGNDGGWGWGNWGRG